MGLNSEGVYRGALIVDVEAAAIPDAADYLEEPTAPSNYVKAEAIASYKAKARAEQLEKAALDIDLARIVAIGWQREDMAAPHVDVVGQPFDEVTLLREFWKMIGPYPYPRMIGWNLLGYDLPLLLRRSMFLGVESPSLEIGKYRHPGIDDLMWLWSFGGAMKFKSLSFVCKRFGIAIDDPLTGADIAQAVREGRWTDVASHCEADIRKTAALASRLGCFRQDTTQPLLAEVI